MYFFGFMVNYMGLSMIKNNINEFSRCWFDYGVNVEG